MALESRLKGDLSKLRIHEGPAVDLAAEALGARGFTLGRHVALSRRAGSDTLAHEAAHALQQDMAEPATGTIPAPVAPHCDPAERMAANAVRSGGPVRGGQPLRVQRDLVDPGRLAEVHESLFVAAPGGGGLQAWQEPSASSPGTAALIHQQAKAAVQQLVSQNPASVGGTIQTRTTQSALDADAIDINDRIRARFPQITQTVSESELRAAVNVMGPGITGDRDFLRQWLSNKLRGWTDIAQFNIDESDPRYVAMLDDILADDDIGGYLRTLASREGVPWSRMIDADRPPHFGETRPTVIEEDATTRAMNRRVEMFLIMRSTP